MLEQMKNKQKKYLLPVLAVFGISAIGGAFLFANKNGKEIADYSKKFVGIREKQQNKGWYNSYFENLMQKVGWKQPQQYCLLFIKMVLLNVLKGEKRSIVNSLFNASSQTTWKNLIAHKNLGLYKLSKKPKIGSIAIYKHMKKTWAGHGDIVIDFDKTGFRVVSANETKGVEEKNRKYSFDSNKFRLLGFVHF